MIAKLIYCDPGYLHMGRDRYFDDWAGSLMGKIDQTGHRTAESPQHHD